MKNCPSCGANLADAKRRQLEVMYNSMSDGDKQAFRAVVTWLYLKDKPENMANRVLAAITPPDLSEEAWYDPAAVYKAFFAEPETVDY